MSYQAIVGRIQISPHPNADRLNIGYVKGARVVVGLETLDNELVVFFPEGGQLSDTYAMVNKLMPELDEFGKRIGGGYFDPNRRVRAQNFRQVKSEGFVMPISSLEYTKFDLSKLKDGDTFDTLNGITICNKFYNKATLAAIKANKFKPSNKVVYKMPEHYDTTQFRFVDIPVGALIHISEKEHGTSVRYGNVKVQRPLKGVKRWFYQLIGNKKPATETQEYVLGTRRAILPKLTETTFSGGWYGNGDPYDIAALKAYGKLKEGEILYGEIVGYTKTGAALFTQNTSNLKDVKKQYGDVMQFSYGCVDGTSKFKVYRITQDGRDLTWFEIVTRCGELGIETVLNYTSFVFDGNRDKLNALVESYLEGPSQLDARHIREGVCLRVESPQGIRSCKSKSWTFGVLEGYVKDNDSIVDMEEIA